MASTTTTTASPSPLYPRHRHPCGLCQNCRNSTFPPIYSCPSFTTDVLNPRLIRTVSEITTLSADPHAIVTTLLQHRLHTSKDSLISEILLDKFRDFAHQPEYRNNNIEAHQLRDLATYLDDIIWGGGGGGLLTPHTSVALIDVNDAAHNKCWYGECAVDPSAGADGNRKAYIRIYKLFEGPGGQLVEQLKRRGVSALQSYIETILHEQCHAILDLFSHRCKACLCKGSLMWTKGLGGHGPAWRRLCEAVEEKATRVLGGMFVGKEWSIDGAHHVVDERALNHALKNSGELGALYRWSDVVSNQELF